MQPLRRVRMALRFRECSALQSAVALAGTLPRRAFRDVCLAALACSGLSVGVAAATESRIALSALTLEPMRTQQDKLAQSSGPVLTQAEAALEADDVEGRPGVPIPLKLSVTGAETLDYLILAFRGLPPEVSLTSGFQTSDAWFVSLSEADSLNLIADESFAGVFDMKVELIRGKGLGPLTRTVKVSISNAPANATASVGNIRNETAGDSGEAAAEAAPDPQSEPLSPGQERRLMALAETLLEQKDIAAARLVYARLARLGSVDAAYTLAQTYDPAFLSRFPIAGLKPDPEKAKRWYKAAAALGSREAPERLTALENAGW